jgi:ABC-type transport system involved in cytochrome c biogenesis permease subunit
MDPGRGVDRAVRIWMNNPLRYAGRTFYQASYKPDGSGTVLQVVRNPGWLLPYISCALVAGGMMLHFGMSLTGFLRRRAKTAAPAVAGSAGQGARPRGARWWLPLVFLCGVLIAVSGLFRPTPADDLDLRAFGQIPVSAGGRIKPMDTAARAMLMAAGGRQQVVAEDGRLPATRYLIDLIARPERIADLPVVRVDHPDVLNLLGLAPEDSGRHALSAIEPHWAQVLDQARRAASVAPRDRDGFQRAVLQLHHRVTTILAHARMQEPYAIPPASPEGDWRPFHEAFLDEHAQTEGPRHPSVVYLASMMTAAQQDDAEGFNSAAHDYLDVLEASMPQVMRKARLEILFNRASMFTGAMAVYILAFLGVCSAMLLRSAGRPRLAEGFRSGSLALLIAAALVHTAAIAIRIHLQGRPPVTNLYSSAIFVGWAAVLAGIVVERLHPLGVAILGSAAIGFGTLVVAHNLGDSGDTMEMMQAVLDSNFWLATHVITITLGYSATFLAAALGGVYLLGRALTGAMSKPRERALGRMIYGVVCFALLLSFVGTVLGGIWADQSWGRFWGWDPKENGAALIVLINAIILHARWGLGMLGGLGAFTFGYGDGPPT